MTTDVSPNGVSTSSALSPPETATATTFDLDPGLKRMPLSGWLRNFIALTWGFVIPFILCWPSVFTIAFLLVPFQAHIRFCEIWTHFWIRTLRSVYRLELDVHGLENIDPDRPYVIVSNHRSWIDALAIIAALDQQLSFGIVIKRELGWIPLVGWFMQLSGYVAVDRGKGRARGKLDNAAKAVRNGRSVLVFPEGTRSPTHQFVSCKKGAALLAKAAGVEMLPIVVTGTAHLWPKGTPFVRPGRVRLEVLPALKVDDDEDIQSATRKMERVLIENYRLTPDSKRASAVPGLVDALMPPRK